MFDFFMPGAIFERVMGSGKIKNKFWGFFWREMLVYLAIVFLIIIVLILTVKGITEMPPLNAVLAMLVMLIPCAVIPVIHFKQLSRTISEEEK